MSGSATEVVPDGDLGLGAGMSAEVNGEIGRPESSAADSGIEAAFQPSSGDTTKGESSELDTYESETTGTETETDETSGYDETSEGSDDQSALSGTAVEAEPNSAEGEPGNVVKLVNVVFDENAVVAERSLLMQPKEVADDDPLLLMLDDPGKTVKDMVACDSLVSVFKAGNQKLIDRLTTDIGMNQLMDVFVKTEDRHVLAKISELFLTSNSRLLESMSQSMWMLETFSQLMYDRENADYYKVGIMTQILTTATFRWPDRMYKLFYQSPTFWPSMLKSFDIESVANAACQLLQSSSPADHGFLWGYLCASIPQPGVPMVHPPKEWNVSATGVVSSEATVIGPKHRLKLIKLFRLFLLSFPDEKEFSEALGVLIRTVVPGLQSNLQLDALLDIALVIPREDAVADATMKVLLKDPIELNPLLEKSLEYLTIYYDDRSFDQLVHFIFKFLASSNTNNFINERVRELVETMLAQTERRTTLIKQMQHIIVYTWNRRGPRCPNAKVALLLSLGDMLGNYQGFYGWSVFIGTVIRQYRRRDLIPKELKIPEDGMDPELINSLVPVPSSKPLSFARLSRDTRTMRFPVVRLSVNRTVVHRRRHSTGDYLVREMQSAKQQRYLLNCDANMKRRGKVSKRASLDPKMRSHGKNNKEGKGRKSVGGKKRNCNVS